MIPVIAASGREALRFIRQGDDFDVAILDTDLRDMSGQELEEKIRKYNSALPLILLVFLGERIPPGHACLTKPIKPSQLHNALMDILAGQPARGSEKSSGINADRPLRNRPLKILLAEDNVSSQKVTLQMLRKLGYKADTVANGIEALHALERQHYNVVLMDIQMPEMDGLEAARVIRRRWQNERIKIIAITAYVLTGDREKCIEAGMDDYLSKPVTLDDLKSVLDKFSHPSD
ncbi:MAG: response regulator [Myxococcota bacterium]|nr:response regulator [Myxococcota bacterium]